MHHFLLLLVRRILIMVIC